MAQVVGFFTNVKDQPDMFKDGPFVLVTVGGMMRLEVQLEGWRCPVIVHTTINKMLLIERDHDIHKSRRRCEQEVQADWLNEQVTLGRIVQINGEWRAPEYQDVLMYWVNGRLMHNKNEQKQKQ